MLESPGKITEFGQGVIELDFDEFSQRDRFQERSQIIKSHEYYPKFEDSFSELISFYENLSGLIFRFPVMFISEEGTFTMGTELIDSVMFTLNSIKSSATRGSLGDAYALTRKMRDDTLLYLYLLEAEERHSPLKVDKNNKNPEKHAIEWMKNELSYLYAWQMVDFLRENKEIDEVVRKHELEDNMEQIREELLNNCVHTNGKVYASINYDTVNVDFGKHLRKLEHITNLITIIFLTYLIFIKPHFISSTDYVDALDVGMTPESGSQYWVAPFIQDFVDEKINKYDPKLKEFLSYNTHMEID